MKILCSRKPIISELLMSTFKEDLRQIFKNHGHSMGSFHPKKTYGASCFCKLRILKSDIPSFREEFLTPDTTWDDLDNVENKYNSEGLDTAIAFGPGVISERGPYYVCAASEADIADASLEQMNIIFDDFMNLVYAVEMETSESRMFPYGVFYLYPDSKNPKNAYNSDYVVLSGTVHFHIDPEYQI